LQRSCESTRECGWPLGYQAILISALRRDRAVIAAMLGVRACVILSVSGRERPFPNRRTDEQLALT
jgi:hypothetical protein